MNRVLFLAAFLLASSLTAADRPDLLVADFEGDAYPEGWVSTGTAFGKGPARGTLPGQMHVDGFLGKGLVNSFLGGDDATGTLTSSEFKLERKFLNFLIGGGKHEKTCINLLIDGKIARTATGPNDRPGGSERLDWHTWDIAEFEGKMAKIQIVDEQKGGWGHINIDHIVQSDKKKQAEPFTAEFEISKRYLHLPVKTGAPMRRMSFTVNGQIVREFDIELDTSAKPQFWAFADVSAFQGKKLTASVMIPADAKPTIPQSNDVPAEEKLYREKHRPLFHFTSRFGWLNDPNGLVYHDKEWHLFYQHNPFGVNWGNMHWGHAVSPDLFHWKELGIGLYPKKYGDMAFSGSAVLDKGNTSGWGTKDKPPLALAFTSTGRGECIAFSNDNGRTWTEHDNNPVVKHAGRDPKLVWYEKGKHWIMAVYDEFQGKQWIAFHTSPDLKSWTFASRIEGFFECPDLFEMAADALDLSPRKWVLYAADGRYVVGNFDGKEFKPESKGKKQLWYGNFYAAQSFDNTPLAPLVDGPTPSLPLLPRRIQIGWANGVTFPEAPFNQQMTVPVELRPETGPEGLRLTAMPVKELLGLREDKPAFAHLESDGLLLLSKSRVLAENVDAFDMVISFDARKSNPFVIDLRGTKLVYDPSKATITCMKAAAPIAPLPGQALRTLRILVDRGSVEVFAEEGRVAMSIAAIPDEKNRKVELIPREGDVVVHSAFVYRMKSAWQK